MRTPIDQTCSPLPFLQRSQSVSNEGEELEVLLSYPLNRVLQYRRFAEVRSPPCIRSPTHPLTHTSYPPICTPTRPLSHAPFRLP